MGARSTKEEIYSCWKRDPWPCWQSYRRWFVPKRIRPPWVCKLHFCALGKFEKCKLIELFKQRETGAEMVFRVTKSNVTKVIQYVLKKWMNKRKNKIVYKARWRLLILTIVSQFISRYMEYDCFSKRFIYVNQSHK